MAAKAKWSLFSHLSARENASEARIEIKTREDVLERNGERLPEAVAK